MFRLASFEWSPSAKRGMTAFLSLCEDIGVRCMVSAPTYDARHFDLHAQEIEAIYREWMSLIGEYPNTCIISNPKDYAYPLELMYNQEWHVNDIGRRDRTLKLAADILNGCQAF